MRREFVLRAVSYNVQSLRQPESIELVISFMRERGVDIYAVGAGDVARRVRGRD